MNQEQKALYRQAQLAGLGIVVGITGLAVDHPWLPWIGLFVFVLGLLRFFLIRGLIRRIHDPEAPDSGSVQKSQDTKTPEE